MVSGEVDGCLQWIPRYTDHSQWISLPETSVLIHPLANTTTSLKSDRVEDLKETIKDEPQKTQVNVFDPLGVTEEEDVRETNNRCDNRLEIDLNDTSMASQRKKDNILLNTLEMQQSDQICIDIDLPNMEPWRKKRAKILETFTTSDKSSITSSSSISHSPSGSIVDSAVFRAQVRVIDRTAHRLEILEDMSGLKRLADLSAHEYIQNVNELKETLILAWNNNKRVEAFRVVTELSRALSSVSPPSLYPSQWIVVTDVLDLFGKLVFQRIYDKANQERKSHGKPPLNPKFTSDDVMEQARETAKNWFVKLGDVKELVPRFYVESCLIGCMRFFDSPSLRVNLQRLAAMSSRIGQPLPAAYARAYISKIAIFLDPADRAPHWRVLNDWMQTFGQQPSELMWPAAEWIIQCVSYGAHSYQDLSPLWEYCKQTDKRAFILRCFLRSIPPKYLANHAIEAMKIVLMDGSTGRELRDFGSRLLEAEVPEEARPVLLKNIWKAILRLESTGEMMKSSVIWVQFAARYFTIDEIHVITDCLLGKIKTEKCPDLYVSSLLSIIQSIVSQKRIETSTLLSLDSFTGLLDILRDEPYSSEAAISVLSAFITSTSPHSLNDLRLANQICELCARLATFLYDNRQEEMRRTKIICAALDRFSLDGDEPDRCLEWLVKCRSSLAENDQVIQHIVRLFLSLGLHIGSKEKIDTRRANLMRACVANLHITIPSLPLAEDRFDLSLQSAHLALHVNSLPQTDALIRICIESLLDLDGDGIFIARLNHLLAFLVFVPDSPEKSTLYLFKAVVSALDCRNWENELTEKGATFIHCLDFLWAIGRSDYPNCFPKVQSNDSLYGGSRKFREEIMRMGGEILDRILPILEQEGKPVITAMLLEHFIARTDYQNNPLLFNLCRRLIEKCKKWPEFRKRLSQIAKSFKQDG